MENYDYKSYAKKLEEERNQEIINVEESNEKNEIKIKKIKRIINKYNKIYSEFINNKERRRILNYVYAGEKIKTTLNDYEPIDILRENFFNETLFKKIKENKIKKEKKIRKLKEE